MVKEVLPSIGAAALQNSSVLWFWRFAIAGKVRRRQAHRTRQLWAGVAPDGLPVCFDVEFSFLDLICSVVQWQFFKTLSPRGVLATMELDRPHHQLLSHF